MAEMAKEIIPVNLEDEMRRSYLDYAMSVIVGALCTETVQLAKPLQIPATLAVTLHGMVNRPGIRGGHSV